MAVLAASLGVSSVIVGIMVGAFALALGTWLGKMPKKDYVPGQYYLLSAVIFFSTVIPIMPLIRDFDPLYINWWGSYGTFFHNTYTMDLYLVGVAIGTFIILIAPSVSKNLTKLRKGKFLPYQGISLTLLLLVLASIIVEVIL